jgi:hypothetical protein
VVLTKFPHYKAVYRLAQEQYLEKKNYRLCVSLLFDRFFLPLTGINKQQHENNLLNRLSLFENICEILGSDLNRSVSEQKKEI